MKDYGSRDNGGCLPKGTVQNVTGGGKIKSPTPPSPPKSGK